MHMVATECSRGNNILMNSMCIAQVYCDLHGGLLMPALDHDYSLEGLVSGTEALNL
jgi:hypothetical protein